MTTLQRIALAVPFVVFLGIYGSSVGHGFVADDFAWILDSRVHGLAGFPSIGACLIAADVAARRWPVATTASRRAVAIAGIVIAIGLTPIYILRNRTSIANARFSSSVLHDMASATSSVPDGATVIVVDDRRRRPNVETAFNVALTQAFELSSGRRLQFWVEPPPQHAKIAGLVPPCATCAALTVTIRDGHVVN